MIDQVSMCSSEGSRQRIPLWAQAYMYLSGAGWSPSCQTSTFHHRHVDMPSLTDLVVILAPEKDDEPEDIFACAPGLIFTDDLRNLHGSPDGVIIYKSARFGDVRMRTTDPESESERKLFSHYLWNAGVKMAELISRGDDGSWSVSQETVLELGAGGDSNESMTVR